MTPTTPDIPSPGEGPEREERAKDQPINWIQVAGILWSSRKFIAIFAGATTILAVALSLILPEYYRSMTTLLPETEKSKLAALGGLSDLASLAGVNVGAEGSFAKLYPTIIKSEAVLKNVIYSRYQTGRFSQPVNLVQFWDVSNKIADREYEVALKMLREDLDVSLDNKTGVVTLSIETREPKLSADILNAVTEEFDEFIRTRRITNASEQRKWIEQRLVEVNGDLQSSENKLKEFREKNRRIGDSPELQLAQARMMRDVEINSTVYVELKKQLELARIEEIKNVPVVSVMDSARPAAYRDRPRRTNIVSLGFLLGILTGGVVTVANKFYGERARTLVKKITGQDGGLGSSA